jgi:hypothetical protein
MEFTSGRTRTIGGILYQGIYTLGVLYSGLAAYFERDWRWLQLAAGAPAVVFVAYYWFGTYYPTNNGAYGRGAYLGCCPNHHVGYWPNIASTKRDASSNVRHT